MPFSKLKVVGFSDKDIKVYELLVKQGEAKKTEIMAKTKLTKAEFEEVIRKLVTYNAVEESGDKINANSPKSFLQKYYLLKETDEELKLNDLRNNVEELKGFLEPIYSEKRLGMRLEEIMRTLDGLPTMELETVRIISRAKNEVCIFAEQFSWFNKVREELISALDRKVKIRALLLVKNNVVKERVEEMKQMGINVRHVVSDWRNTRYTIADKEEMVFLIWAQKSASSRIFYRPAYTQNSGLVNVTMDSFELLWERSEPF